MSSCSDCARMGRAMAFKVELIDGAAVQELGGARALAAHLRALVPSGADVEEQVRAIVADVRREGDPALIEHTRRLDWPDASAERLIVATDELDEAIGALAPDVYAALERAISNVAQVAAAATADDVAIRLAEGQRIAVRELPVASAGVYVPAGRSPYASTVVMGTVTARAAGVLDVAVCTPPGPDGRIDPAVLAVYRMGGAQAIAALAYGTERVAAVDVIVGPGNLYVQEAKRQCAGTVGIDLFAGPSDLLILFEGDEHLGSIALDLAAQAEHGHGTLIVAASPQREALERLALELEQIGAQRQLQPSACALAQIAGSAEGIELANALAPEHLQLIGAALEQRAPQVRAAGCLFLGPYAATAFGDYIAGSNHILPTAGAARFASALSTAAFRRRMYEVQMDAKAAGALAELAAPLALAEGFPLHARSMLARSVRPGLRAREQERL